MKPINQIELPNDIEKLKTIATNTMMANRHLAAQNGRLIIQVDCYEQMLGKILTVYQSEDGQALINLLAQYSASANAHMAFEKAAKGAHINTSAWVQ
jgi:hypothetical protein